MSASRIRNGVKRLVTKNLSHPLSQYKYINYLNGINGFPNQEIIQNCLQHDGYCLVRNTNLENDLFDADRSSYTVSNLQHCVFGTNDDKAAMDYSHGTDERPKYNSALLGVNDEVSGSNFIHFHNELCYTQEFPKIIAFICMTPSTTGGYTPLSNVCEVWKQLPSNMKDKFMKYGIKYVRNIRDKEAELGIKDNSLDVKGQKCWQDLFYTNDANEAEIICNEVYKYDTEWIKCRTNNTPILRITYNLAAAICITNDEQNEEFPITAFANSMLGMHGSIYDSYDAYYDSLPYLERPLHSMWGNGDEFTNEEIETVKDLYQQNAIRFKWKAGDIIIADNLKWAHGRYPYEGDRKILALMGVPWKREGNSLFVSPVNI